MYAVNSSCVMSIAKKKLKGQGSETEEVGTWNIRNERFESRKRKIMYKVFMEE